MAVKAVQFRLSLARYIYTAMFRSNLYGGMVVRPAAFDFPAEKIL